MHKENLWVLCSSLHRTSQQQEKTKAGLLKVHDKGGNINENWPGFMRETTNFCYNHYLPFAQRGPMQMPHSQMKRKQQSYRSLGVMHSWNTKGIIHFLTMFQYVYSLLYCVYWRKWSFTFLRLLEGAHITLPSSVNNIWVCHIM